MYDSSLIVVETLAGEISTIDERNIEQYRTVFEEFASVAVFGDEAERFLEQCESTLSDLGSQEDVHPTETHTRTNSVVGNRARRS